MSNLIMKVGDLKELEKKATPGPWETEESDEGHDIWMGEAIESRGQYQSHHVIEYNHDCQLLDDSTKAEEEQYLEAEANAYLVGDLRNAAPVMLAVLGQFREGDQDEIDYVIQELTRLFGLENIVDTIAVLNRLQEAARLMEDNE